MKKIPPTPGHAAKPGFIVLIRPLRPHYSWNLWGHPLILRVYHECQICLRFHWILKVILEMAFSAHWAPIWKLNRISMTIINKVAGKCIWCCHRVQQCVMVPHSGVKLCSGAWKRGQDSHVDMFFLWTWFPPYSPSVMIRQLLWWSFWSHIFPNPNPPHHTHTHTHTHAHAQHNTTQHNTTQHTPWAIPLPLPTSTVTW